MTKREETRAINRALGVVVDEALKEALSAGLTKPMDLRFAAMGALQRFVTFRARTPGARERLIRIGTGRD